MKIADVEVIVVKGRKSPRSPMVFVEVHTDEGITGLGEALPNQGVALVGVLRELGAALRGADPFQIETHWERFYRLGAHMPAVSGLETAMWDIIGQALGVPIYSLLGGACHENIHVYVDGFFRGNDPTPEAQAQAAQEAVAQGFDALKLDVDDYLFSGPGGTAGKSMHRGIQPSELRAVVATVAAIREAVGGEVHLALDCHWAFDVTSAVELGRALEPYHLMWFEDPIPAGNPKALAKLRSGIAVPICVGEVLETRYAFREIL
jgi:galactonate dehydratase